MTMSNHSTDENTLYYLKQVLNMSQYFNVDNAEQKF